MYLARHRDGAARRWRTVYFGPGTWDLIDVAQMGVNLYDGIIVARRRAFAWSWQRRGSEAQRMEHSNSSAGAFTLAGSTAVTGLRFSDVQQYEPNDRAGPFLQLGGNFQQVAADRTLPATLTIAEDFFITRNVFDKTFTAIGDGGLPIERLFVTFNTIGAYFSDLSSVAIGST